MDMQSSARTAALLATLLATELAVAQSGVFGTGAHFGSGWQLDPSGGLWGTGTNFGSGWMSDGAGGLVGTGRNFGSGWMPDGTGGFVGTGANFGSGWQSDGRGGFVGTGRNFGSGWQSDGAGGLVGHHRTAIQQRGVDVARKDADGPNPAGTLLGVDGLGQAGQTELGHHISRTRLGGGLFAGIGDDVDDGARSPLAHSGQEGLHAVIGAIQVGIHHRPIVGVGKHFQGPLRSIGARRIDQHLDGPHLVFDARAHRAHRFLAGDVALEGGDATGPITGQRPGFFEGRAAAPQGDNRPPGLHQSQHAGLPDTRAAPGHHCQSIHGAEC